MNNQPVLDSENAICTMGDDREMFNEVLELYLESTPELFELLARAVRSSDRDTVKRLAHTLKSSTVTIGGMQLGVSALYLENSAQTMETSAMLQYLTSLKDRYNELVSVLREEGFIPE